VVRVVRHGTKETPVALRGVPSVAQMLYGGETVCAFDFFQAIRLLTRLCRKERVRIGLDGPPTQEAVRFLAHISLNFPASAIQRLVRPAPDQPAPMTVNFMGLTGPSGVLPRHYTERLFVEGRGEERHALRDWLDLFNHRLISLFYRAWEKYRFFLPFERGEWQERDLDAFSRCLYSMIGLGFPSHRRRFRVTYALPRPRVAPDAEPVVAEKELTRLEDIVFFRFAGLFAHRPRNAVSLEAFLEIYLQLPVKVLQFQGRWLHLDDDSQSALGRCNARMGTDALVGDRIWDVQSKVRIRLGPLTYEQFLEFLPDQTPLARRKRIYLLAQVVRYYLGAEVDVDFQLVLRQADVPTTHTGPHSRLGWNTWCRRKPYPRHAEDSVFTVTDRACIHEISPESARA
jgi:type VI secretion system protein ImpH